jgi:hypothetical protein
MERNDVITRPHFTDLRRRYREADWVSEFQRLWAIFNHWLVAHFGNHQDRDCIEHLKATPKLTRWIGDVIQATAYNWPHRVTDGYGGSYPRFAADNEISCFFRAVAASPVVEPRLNRPWRAGTEPRVRITHAITLDRAQFRAAYDAHAQVLYENMTFDLTIHQTLPALGVHTTGCCFYRGLPVGTTTYANRLVDLFRASPSLAELVHMIESTEPTDLASDVVETLYNVRNVAMHASLDFLNEQDNAAARAAHDLLDSFIRDIRGRW